MPLAEQVRTHCAAVTDTARHVTIDLDALAALEPAARTAQAPALDPDHHYLDGPPADVAAYLLALDAINFGSGWFPLLTKRRANGAPLSGYFTIAAALAEHFRAHGPWANAKLRAITTPDLAAILGQPPELELIALYAQALRALGDYLGERHALDLVAESGRSAQRLAAALAAGMAAFDDRGFYKRAQIAANDLALAGLAEFDDIDELTIFADNVVPHVLRCDGVLVYDAELAGHIDAGRVLPFAAAEHELRASAVHACELLAARTGVPPRALDTWLWNRGQAPEYKARPRHRCRTVYY